MSADDYTVGGRGLIRETKLSMQELEGDTRDLKPTRKFGGPFMLLDPRGGGGVITAFYGS